MLADAKGIVDFPSSSDKTVVYRVDTVRLRCDCPGWKFSKTQPRFCRHLRELGFTPDMVPKPKYPNHIVNPPDEQESFTKEELAFIRENL